jgi:hypothetical protein
MNSTIAHEVNATSGNFGEDAPAREKRKEPTESPSLASSDSAPTKSLEHLDWWQSTVEAATQFLTVALADKALKTLLETPQTGSITLLPPPPVADINSRIINNEKDGKIPCIQRDAFTSVKEFVEGKKGLTYVDGPPGIGKSFALYHLFCALSIDPNNRVLYIANCDHLNKNASHKLFKSIIAAFALDEPFLKQTRHYTMKLDEFDWNDLVEEMVDYCESGGLTFYAIFDQYNDLNSEQRITKPTNFTQWPSIMPGAKIILSSLANNEDIPMKLEDNKSVFCFPEGGYTSPELKAWQSYFKFFDGQDLSIVTQTTANIPFELDMMRSLHVENTTLDLPNLVTSFQQSRILDLNLSHGKYEDDFLQKQEDGDMTTLSFCNLSEYDWSVVVTHLSGEDIFQLHLIGNRHLSCMLYKVVSTLSFDCISSTHLCNLQLYSRLTSLSVTNQDSFTDDGLTNLPHTLTYLNLFNNLNITDAGLANLPRTLTSLHLNFNNNITDAGLTNLPHTLTYLDLYWNNNITDAGLTNLPHTLTHLDLYCNNTITDAGLTNLPHTLTSLNLSYNENITDAGLANLPHTLKYLDLSNNRNITDAGLTNLPHTLTYLNLYCNNNITDDGLTNLPHTLTYLNLTNNLNITDAGLTNLPHTLTSLNLYCNENITDAGLTNLPHTLTFLDLTNNKNITDAGLTNLPHTLKVHISKAL